MLGAAHGSSDFLPFNSPDVNKGVARVDARRQNGHFLVCGFAMAELLRDQKISDVAVAKLDIEGHELEALKGLLKTESALPHHIVLEFWGGEPSHPEMTNDRVVQYLESKGYQITLIDGSPFKPNGEIPESNLWAHLKADAQY